MLETLGISCGIFKWWFAKGMGLVGYGLPAEGSSKVFLISKYDLTGSTPLPNPPAAYSPETGWYWNQSESGRGFFIEKSGANIVFSGYLYNTAGAPIWHLGLCEFKDSNNPNTCNGTLDSYKNGQTLTGAYKAAQLNGNAGTFRLDFTSNRNVTMTWPAGTLNLERFTFTGTNPANTPPAAANGWWWNAAESGRGWSVEFQNGNAFIAGYMYDEPGNPIWYVAGGAMSDARTFEQPLAQYANGQAMGAPYRAPNVTNPNVATIRFKLSDVDPNAAILTIPGRGDVPVVRFKF